MWKCLIFYLVFFSMCNEFSQIFQLCQFVMVSFISLIMFLKILPSVSNNVINTNGPLQENSQNAPLVHATLETLLRFLNWIPLGYIFETKLISTLIYKVLMQKLTALKFKYKLQKKLSVQHSCNTLFFFFSIVLKCSHVSKCLFEVPHRDCRCQCKPV